MALVYASTLRNPTALARFALTIAFLGSGICLTADAVAQVSTAEEGAQTTAAQRPAEVDDSSKDAAQDDTPTIPRSKEPLRVKSLRTPNTSLSGIGTGTTPEDATDGRLPSPMALPYGPDREAGWSVKTKHWVAPAYCHLPTYYEDVMLEQHGQERFPPLQPLASGARFYSGIFFTPYLAYMRPPLRDIPSTGSYRPGSCAPALRQRAPFDPGAIKFQAAATATGVLALQP